MTSSTVMSFWAFRYFMALAASAGSSGRPSSMVPKAMKYLKAQKDLTVEEVKDYHG